MLILFDHVEAMSVRYAFHTKLGPPVQQFALPLLMTPRGSFGPIFLKIYLATLAHNLASGLTMFVGSR